MSAQKRVKAASMRPSRKPTRKRVDPLERFRGERKAAATARENKRLLQRLNDAEERAEIAEALRASARPLAGIRTRTPVNLHKRVATPVFVCSDWHVEETVKPETVNGLNSYDLATAEQRIKRLAKSMQWMIDHHRKSFEIRECVIGLLGDMMSGYIHEELMEGNSLSPIQTILWLQDKISECVVRGLLELPGIERLTFVCLNGNHGRNGQKLKVASRAANSYEWLLYHQLRRTHGTHARQEWHVADGELAYIKIHGINLRATHGDGVNYQGGVGGITIPINKALARWDEGTRADFTIMGHFHNLHYLPRFCVNGPLIGTSAYGLRFGHQPPAQASFLIDSKRGPCLNTTLWVAPREQGAP